MKANEGKRGQMSGNEGSEGKGRKPDECR